MNFASDNTAGIASAILDAMRSADQGFAPGYGADDLTRRVEERIAEVFQREVAVFLVPTGTAANALAIAHLSPSWGGVLCHAESHIAVDECGAPEFFGAGLKLIELPGVGAKIAPGVLRTALAQERRAPHSVVPSVLSLTQATEAGTVYALDELHALAEMAHAHGLAVHMDGARFGNALVRLGVTAADATWKAGVDVLSFGATKSGAMAAEAIVFFDPARAAGMGERRKRGGHLLSKHRFLAAQFDAYLRDDLWLALARHANDAADKLAARLAAAGFQPVWPVEANEVFVVLTGAADRKLRAAGAHYHPWSTNSLPADIAIGPDDVLVRLVTSFATSGAEIEIFAEIVAGC